MTSEAPVPVKVRTKTSIPTFELFDMFAVSHYDRRRAEKRTDKKFLDAVTVGHVLHRVRVKTRTAGPGQQRGRALLEDVERAFIEALKTLTGGVLGLKEMCDRDTLIGELPATPATRMEVPWDDRQFWLLVRMTMALDEGNRRLMLLVKRGGIDKDEMKRRQRELARPYRAALQHVVDLVAQANSEGHT